VFGSPGRIQVTEDIYQQLKHQYLFEKRGRISVKGREEMAVYFLTGHNDFDNQSNQEIAPSAKRTPEVDTQQELT